MGTSLSAFLSNPVVTLCFGIVVGAVSMFFGKVLPAVNETRRVSNSIALDRLRLWEESANGDSARTETLLRLVSKQPEVPDDPHLEGEAKSLADYARVRTQAARDLTAHFEAVKDSRSRIVTARQRAYADPKSNLDKTLAQIQGDLDRNEHALNEIIQRLADYPPIYIGRDAPSNAKDGDSWLKTP